MRIWPKEEEDGYKRVASGTVRHWSDIEYSKIEPLQEDLIENCFEFTVFNKRILSIITSIQLNFDNRVNYYILRSN